MGALTEFLVEEHKVISNQLERIKSQWSEIDLVKELDYLEELLNKHHDLEEKILFPLLYNSKRVQEGGPKCTLFYGLYMNERSFFQEVLKENDYKTEDEVEPLKGYIAEKSALSIPIEEHRVCHILMGKMRDLASQNQNEEAKGVFSKYQKILKQHIRKENECLFRMADGFISPESQKEALDQFLK